MEAVITPKILYSQITTHGASGRKEMTNSISSISTTLLGLFSQAHASFSVTATNINQDSLRFQLSAFHNIQSINLK